jgi:uncharacterized protein YbjT (DUF2867 family)
MILVVGSMDALEYEICFILASQGISIRALILNTSDPAWAERLKNYGATLAWGDLQDPIFLADAYVGVNGVICSLVVLSPDQQNGTGQRNGDLNGIKNLIDTAKDADLLRFVYISFLNRQDLIFPSEKEKPAAEQYLIASGKPYTILHAGHYPSQAFGAGVQRINRISTRDLAWVAVKILENPAQHNTILELGGSLELGPDDTMTLETVIRRQII